MRKKYDRMTECEKRRVVEMFHGGASIAEIASALGFAYITIANFVRRNGLAEGLRKGSKPKHKTDCKRCALSYLDDGFCGEYDGSGEPILRRNSPLACRLLLPPNSDGCPCFKTEICFDAILKRIKGMQK